MMNIHFLHLKSECRTFVKSTETGVTGRGLERNRNTEIEVIGVRNEKEAKGYS